MLRHLLVRALQRMKKLQMQVSWLEMRQLLRQSLSCLSSHCLQQQMVPSRRLRLQMMRCWFYLRKR